MSYQTLKIAIADGIAEVTLCRPDKLNTMNVAFWEEVRRAFVGIDAETGIRAAILAAEGPHFTAGLDIEDFGSILAKALEQAHDPARRGEAIRRLVLEMQETFNVIERCRVPVIAAVQGACIGGGIDMIAACDLRYCSADAFFVVKEIDLGIVADLGTLQRLPKIVAPGVAREMALTARRVDAQRAREIGLVNAVHADHATLLAEAREVAAEIAARSPLAVTGTKQVMNHARDHSVAEGLEYVATWQAGMFISPDLLEAARARMEKRGPAFKPLHGQFRIRG
ncbi:MAG: crotonase/enoyl-CoA hydratase family protein [Alphaproteobacteria bacterium]|nr:crotonase/enoyl-CoA hydratase family protein [Alphaproteobacteria bacterium]